MSLQFPEKNVVLRFGDLLGYESLGGQSEGPTLKVPRQGVGVDGFILSRRWNSYFLSPEDPLCWGPLLNLSVGVYNGSPPKRRRF